MQVKIVDEYSDANNPEELVFVFWCEHGLELYAKVPSREAAIAGESWMLKRANSECDKCEPLKTIGL